MSDRGLAGETCDGGTKLKIYYLRFWDKQINNTDVRIDEPRRKLAGSEVTYKPT